MVVGRLVVICTLVSACSASKASECEANVDGTCKASGAPRENVRTIEEDIAYNCPAIFGEKNGRPILRNFFQFFSSIVHFFDSISMNLLGKELVTPGWADHYTTAAYIFVVRFAMSIYSARDKTYMKVPSAVAPNETLKVGNVYAPHVDVDGYPNFLWLEKYIPGFLIRPFVLPAQTCFYNGLRELEFADAIDSASENTWSVVLKSGKYKSKKDWLLSFYDNVKTWSKDPTWPGMRVDYSRLFRKADIWDDGLEKALAFDGIAAHRVVVVEKEFGGETLPFAIKFNAFAALEVRPGFGKYGGDMYFNADGFPVLLEKPDGGLVQRGDKDWQYWKFVWRSTCITMITLIDHLHFTHFKVSNMLARGTRMGLPPDHSARRMMSIFTFGAIFVNLQAQYTLVGQNMLLHRATPVKDFPALSEAVPAMLPDIMEQPGVKELLRESVYQQLPPLLQEAPFFADGRLMMGAFLRLAKGLSESAGSNFCKNGTLYDPAFATFIHMMEDQYDEAHYVRTFNTCEVLVERVAAYMFVVTAYHSHVGFVGDHYADPDLAVMSWKEGETSGRPRQAIITSIINVFTSTRQPLLNDDYTHLFKGISEDAQLTTMWRLFLEDLKKVKAEIDSRNSNRKVAYRGMDPAILESSVAK